MDFSKFRPRHLLAAALALASAIALTLSLTRAKLPFSLGAPDEPQIVVSSGTVQPDQILYNILAQHQLTPPTISAVQTTLAKKFDLRRLRAGKDFEITSSTDGVFHTFAYHDSPTHSYVVSRSTEGVFSLVETEQQTVWTERFVTVQVTDNLYKDLLKAGYDESFVAYLVWDLADNIFAWRIDFFTEQRPGDVMQVLLEQEYIVGSDKPLPGGRVLAAAYYGRATKQKENYAFRYHAPSEKRPDYFDVDGKAVRKAFLRAPFTQGAFRISSGFNPRRFHPILRTYRPHHGTDYAAVTGTPVVAIGKGTVVHAGWKGGYGNCIDIRHNGNYVSRYGHLSKIRVRPGQSVNQGQLIGNVGSTGRSTGPHLHFEMLVGGTQRNFLTMNFPSATSVAQTNLPEFNRVRDDLMARLDVRRGTAAVPSAPAVN